MNQKIIDAIKNLQLLEFSYEGGSRILEPHCYGKSTAGNESLRAYQTEGFSSEGELGWKMFNLNKATNLIVKDKTFSGPRDGYKRGDKGMSEIYAEL